MEESEQQVDQWSEQQQQGQQEEVLVWVQVQGLGSGLEGLLGGCLLELAGGCLAAAGPAVLSAEVGPAEDAVEAGPHFGLPCVYVWCIQSRS